MIPVEQRQLYSKELNTTGDCWKCCIASVLELNYDSVPHFVEDNIKGKTDSWWNATQNFVKKYGLVIAYFGLHGKNTPYLCFGNEKPKWHFHSPGHWIAGVLSPRYTEEDGEPGGHVVVMSGDKVVFDPHPQRDLGHLGFTDAYLLVRL